MTATSSPEISVRNLDDSAIALGGHSPVSMVDHDRAELGSPDHKVQHDGVTYYLTNADQRDAFMADPTRYEPAFGGWCAFGMSIDKQFRTDPTSFKVVDGRLLVFLNDLEVDALALWDQGDQDELMAKATTAWERRNA